MKKARLQFGPGTLLFSVALLAAGLGVWSWGRQKAVFQRRAKAHLAEILVLQDRADRVEGLLRAARFQRNEDANGRWVSIGFSCRFPYERDDAHAELVLEHELAWLNRVLAHHKALKAKYDALAAQPWRSVDPDPPGPVRSVRQEEDEIEKDTEDRWRRHLAIVKRRSNLAGR